MSDIQYEIDDSVLLKAKAATVTQAAKRAFWATKDGTPEEAKARKAWDLARTAELALWRQLRKVASKDLAQKAAAQVIETADLAKSLADDVNLISPWGMEDRVAALAESARKSAKLVSSLALAMKGMAKLWSAGFGGMQERLDKEDVK